MPLQDVDPGDVGHVADHDALHTWYNLYEGKVLVTDAGVYATAATVSVASRVTADTQDRFQQLTDGTLKWGPGNAAQDASIWRASAGLLRTDSAIQSFLASAGLTAFAAIVSGDTNSRFGVSAAGVVSWGPGNAVADITFQRMSAAHMRLTDAMLEVLRSSNAANAFRTSVTGEAFQRFNIDAKGLMQWGAGTVAVDVELYRYAANVLGTNDEIRSVRGASSNIAFSAIATGDSSTRFTVAADGSMQWGPGNAAHDVRIARAAAGILSLSPSPASRLRGEGSVAGDIQFEAMITADTVVRWVARADGKQEWGPGNAALDVSLYRSAAGLLQVDGAFTVRSAAAATAALSTWVNGDTAVRWIAEAGGRLSWSAGAGAQDVFLERTAAGVLRVTGKLNATTGFQLNGVDTVLKGFVNHAADANVARPAGYASIEWYGSVAPNNAVAGDTWVDTA